VTTAPAADQRRLLEVQALDTRAAQLAHRRRTLPVLAELEAVRAELAEVERHQVEARTRVRDLTREVAKAEADVEQVRSRAARDRQRLDSGAGSAKDMQALTHELDSLARRQAVLEEVELEAMESLDEAERALQAIIARAADLTAQETALKAQAEASLSVIDADAVAVTADRAAAARDLDPGLLALYERIRAHSGGLGAAALRGNRCEGCRLELNATELAGIRAMRPDDVARCEECGRILVRTESGGRALG
jgi:predicted  nucleic acid-binding Zn-ribbon protein